MVTDEQVEELRDIVRTMLEYLELSTDILIEATFDDLVALGSVLSVQHEIKRKNEENADDPDEKNWLHLELVEEDVSEERPFDADNLPPGRKWCDTAAEAFNAVIPIVMSGKPSFRFRRNKETGQVVQVLYG